MSRSNLSPIEQATRDNLQRYFPENDPTFVLAVSGGMDSMSLLHAFKQLDVSAVVCHINYQKRGAASENDARLVYQTATEWEFDCHIERADPIEAEGKNFQQWARDFRYKCFRRLVRKHEADGIAVAHHEDDQVETILQKIFRGAGLASWSAMDIWDGELFRPLLEISRAQIEAYIQQNDIPYRTDESNLETDFARNLLRNEWLDKLGDFFPGWKRNVLRIQQQADNYGQALKWIAAKVTKPEGIDRKAFNALEPGLQKAVLLRLLKKYQPDVSISNESLDRVSELGNLQTGKVIELTPDISVLRDREYYVIEGSEKSVFNPKTLKRKDFAEGSIAIKKMNLSLTNFEHPDYQNVLYLDEEKLTWPITVRRWKQGDAFQPFGMQGHQQVADHLTNRKISAAHKKQALVIESFEETICAIIFPPIKNQMQPGTISEQVKCDPETEKCLKITYRI